MAENQDPYSMNRRRLRYYQPTDSDGYPAGTADSSKPSPVSAPASTAAPYTPEPLPGFPSGFRAFKTAAPPTRGSTDPSVSTLPGTELSNKPTAEEEAQHQQEMSQQRDAASAKQKALGFHGGATPVGEVPVGNLDGAQRRDGGQPAGVTAEAVNYGNLNPRHIEGDTRGAEEERKQAMGNIDDALFELRGNTNSDGKRAMFQNLLEQKNKFTSQAYDTQNNRDLAGSKAAADAAQQLASLNETGAKRRGDTNEFNQSQQQQNDQFGQTFKEGARQFNADLGEKNSEFGQTFKEGARQFDRKDTTDRLNTISVAQTAREKNAADEAHKTSDEQDKHYKDTVDFYAAHPELTNGKDPQDAATARLAQEGLASNAPEDKYSKRYNSSQRQAVKAADIASHSGGAGLINMLTAGQPLQRFRSYQPTEGDINLSALPGGGAGLNRLIPGGMDTTINTGRDPRTGEQQQFSTNQKEALKSGLDLEQLKKDAETRRFNQDQADKEKKAAARRSQ